MPVSISVNVKWQGKHILGLCQPWLPSSYISKSLKSWAVWHQHNLLPGEQRWYMLFTVCVDFETFPWMCMVSMKTISIIYQSGFFVGSKKVKVCFYMAQYPIHWTAQSALHFTSWQICSLRQQLDFSWKLLATVQLLCEESLTIQPLSTAM